MTIRLSQIDWSNPDLKKYLRRVKDFELKPYDYELSPSSDALEKEIVDTLNQLNGDQNVSEENKTALRNQLNRLLRRQQLQMQEKDTKEPAEPLTKEERLEILKHRNETLKKKREEGISGQEEGRAERMRAKEDKKQKMLEMIKERRDKEGLSESELAAKEQGKDFIHPEVFEEGEEARESRESKKEQSLFDLPFDEIQDLALAEYQETPTENSEVEIYADFEKTMELYKQVYKMEKEKELSQEDADEMQKQFGTISRDDQDKVNEYMKKRLNRLYSYLEREKGKSGAVSTEDLERIMGDEGKRGRITEEKILRELKHLKEQNRRFGPSDTRNEEIETLTKKLKDAREMVSASDNGFIVVGNKKIVIASEEIKNLLTNINEVLLTNPQNIPDHILDELYMIRDLLKYELSGAHHTQEEIEQKFAPITKTLEDLKHPHQEIPASVASIKELLKEAYGD